MTFGRPGDLLASRYRLDRPVGSHGVVEHWLGYDERLARSVTVRLAPVADEAAQEESAQAALSTMARLNHPGVAAVYDVGTVETPDYGPVSYAVSEWIDGRTLGQMMAIGPQPWPRTADWGRQIAGALAALHAIGIVHGSLGPNSVAIHDDRQVKILDAGLDSPPSEQIPPFDAPDDVYSLGMLLWYATVDAAPEFGPQGLDQIPLLHLGAPPELAGLFAELLDPDPYRRPTAAAAERRFGPFAVTERVSDTVPGVAAAVAPTQVLGPATQVLGPATRMSGPATGGTRAAGAAATEPRSRRGLWIGLALLLAAVGTAVGLVVANLGNSNATTPETGPTDTGTSSPGSVTLPSGASSSASQAASSAPATSAAPSTPASTAATSASASPSKSPTPSQSPSPSGVTTSPQAGADGTPSSSPSPK